MHVRFVLLLAVCAGGQAFVVKTIPTACLRPGALRACSASPCMISGEDGTSRKSMATSLATKAVTLFSALSFGGFVAHPQDAHASPLAGDSSEVAQLRREESLTALPCQGHERTRRERVAFAVGNEIYSAVTVADAAVQEEAPTTGVVKDILNDPHIMLKAMSTASAAAIFLLIKGSPSKRTKKKREMRKMTMAQAEEPAKTEDPAAMLLRMKKEETASAVGNKMSSTSSSWSSTVGKSASAVTKVGNRPSAAIMGTMTTKRVEMPEAETRFAGFDGRVEMGKRPSGYQTTTLIAPVQPMLPAKPGPTDETENK